MLYDQHCSILLAEFNMFTKNAYVGGYETSGEEKNKALFWSPPPRLAIRAKCRVRLAWLCGLDTDCLTRPKVNVSLSRCITISDVFYQYTRQ